MTDQKILIIGSGFAAAIMLLHLSEAGINPAQVTIIGPGKLGTGNAYGCENDDFRLNVRSSQMWIWPDRRDDFSQWAKANIDDPEAIRPSGVFYRRRDFGRYVADCLASALSLHHRSSKTENVGDGFESAATYHHDQNNVVALGKTYDGGWHARLSDGRIIDGDIVVLATGNPSPRWPCSIDHRLAVTSRYTAQMIKNPWSGSWLDALPPQANIGIIGAGLTALDAVTALAKRRHQAKILLVAPHGSFPPVQASWVKYKSPTWPAVPRPSGILRRFRSYLPDLPPENASWQQAFEELRTDIDAQWVGLNDPDKRRLMHRLGWLWSRYRYRASPQTIEAATKLQAKDILQICRGRLVSIDLDDSKTSTKSESAAPSISLTVNSGTGKNSIHYVDYVINCTGVGYDPLLAQVAKAGFGVCDAFGHGLKVNIDNEVLRPDGMGTKNLIMVGPAMASSLGDVVAASEISLAAKRVAERLVNEVF